MRRFALFLGAAVLFSSATAVSASTWQVEEQTEGFSNTHTVTAFVMSEHAKIMVRCENKDRIMAVFQPANIISEAGPLFTRYRIGKNSTVESNNWISLYGVAAYIGAKKDDKNRQEIVEFARSLMKGETVLIETEHEREKFELKGSKTAISQVLKACNVG